MRAKEGLSRNKRWLEALDPDFVGVDEHSFEELLAFSARYAGLLNFYDTDNKVRGSWIDLFTADLSVILALIISEDIESFKSDYQQNEELIIRTGRKNEDRLFSSYSEMVQHLVGMAAKFDFWISELRQFTKMESAFYEELEQAVKSLKKSYRQLRAYSLGAEAKDGLNRSLEIDFVKYRSIGKADDVQPDASIYTGDTIGDKIKEATEHLKPLFDAFYETLAYIKKIAPKYLKESLEQGNHHPQIGLLMAFLKLYRHGQKQINGIKSRHTDFYYRRILRQKPNPPTPDKVQVCLQLAEETDAFLLKKGTKFTAGKDESGQQRIYSVRKDVPLNKAVICKLRTLYVSRNRYIEVSSDQLVSGIYEARIREEASGDDAGSTYAWPTLGEDQIGVSNEGRTMSDSEIGFAVASPALILNEGMRDITFTITFEPSSFTHFTEQLTKISQNTETHYDESFFKAFRQAFHIALTTEEGWLQMHAYGVEQGEGSSLEINFHLSDEDPALYAFDAALHGNCGFDTKLPVARFLLNKDSFIYPYSLLAEMKLQQIEITTKVDEVKDLVVYNDLGQVNTDKPFQPFGPAPQLGSGFIIGSKEIFSKAVDSLTLKIEWTGIPRDEGGFAEYYRAYEGYAIDNRSFCVDFSLLKKGKWVYPENSNLRKHYLFETEEVSTDSKPHPFGKLKRSTTFENLELEEFKLSPHMEQKPDPLMLNKTTKSGFIKFELTGADVQFGHKKYPLLVSEVFVKNARIKKEKNKLEVPNEPYTPVIRSVTLGYTDQKRIKLDARTSSKKKVDGGTLYHMMPFGQTQKVYPRDDLEPVSLLPELSQKGALYIGIDKLQPPDTLTLFFNIKGKNLGSFEDTRTDLEWYFLADDEWLKFRPNQVLSDSTGNLLRSGIVTLEIPHDINKNNTILEDSLHWIKVAGTQNIEMIGDTVDVCAQAATLVWDTASSSGAHLESGLPAYSIEGPEAQQPAITGVTQQVKSFGGRPREKEKAFYTRNGERLRHKNRAVNSRDYEQLILEKFPEIYKVNCLSSSTSTLIKPGRILIAVIPVLTDSENVDLLPMANVGLLREIRAYVQRLATPFAQVEVRNPNYERIKVVCAVRFEEGRNNGQSLKRLNEDLKAFLSPWLYETEREIRFGGEVNLSNVSGFIQSRPYVHFVTKLSLLKVSDHEDGTYALSDTARLEQNRTSRIYTSEMEETVEASQAWSILVSARNHHIEMLTEEEVVMAEQTGIDDLELGNSFIID
ncbi:baseplate J/gp47 family protein [Gracilimonas mengyeensis]|uniref:Baseplate J-like protein n=1 Tax=Gracilimonas mengyeensis TaxID=1302730 RepID=A0A521BNF3_9BACT|nr:baseplate J/gp47 family protein [Gracilimonas mengyeensis]SMO48645.1 Baseplate J-like protein [Gracilimonas mengyeensis]